MREIFYILNIADWALMAAGVAAALFMMLINADEPRSARKDSQQRRRDPR